jgi:hypothetical protein
VIDAIDDIARGSQVYDSYGKKSNSRFFLYYGFINQNNDADETPIIARLDEADPGYEYKVEQIGLKNTSQMFKVVANTEEKVMTNFLAYCRYVSFDGDLTKLELERQDKLAAAIQKKQRKGGVNGSSDDSEDLDLEDLFIGHIDPSTAEVEAKMW